MLYMDICKTRISIPASYFEFYHSNANKTHIEITSFRVFPNIKFLLVIIQGFFLNIADGGFFLS